MLSTILPGFSLIAGVIAFEFKSPIKPNGGLCNQAKSNWKILWKYVRLPSFYKPLIFIFLVVIAPGITDAMFYFQTDVLGFTYTTFAYINVISALSSIIGIWLYRVFFQKTPLWKYLLLTTIVYSLVQASNLLLVFKKTYILDLSPQAFTFLNTFLYSTINELHIMPLMVLACYMCPKDVETTFYALVLAVINLGYLISYWTGGIFTIWLGISNTNFSNFWSLILISSIWPVLTLLYLLILPKENELGVKGLEQRTESMTKSVDSSKNKRSSSLV